MSAELQLSVFRQKLSDDVRGFASEIGCWYPRFARLIEEVIPPHRDGSAEPLSESQLRIVEGAAGMAMLRVRFVPDARVYDGWVDCLREIIDELGHGFAEHWRSYSLDTHEQLLQPGLQFADGVALIREWVGEANWYQRAIGSRSGLAGETPPGIGADDLAVLTVQVRRIADSFDQSQPDVVGSRYLANRLGLTTQWVGQMIREGHIPRHCIASGGDGRQWKLYRQKIEEWLVESERARGA